MIEKVELNLMMAKFKTMIRSGSRPGLKVSKTRSDNLRSKPPFLKCMWPFALQRFLR